MSLINISLPNRVAPTSIVKVAVGGAIVNSALGGATNALGGAISGATGGLAAIMKGAGDEFKNKVASVFQSFVPKFSVVKVLGLDAVVGAINLLKSISLPDLPAILAKVTLEITSAISTLAGGINLAAMAAIGELIGQIKSMLSAAMGIMNMVNGVVAEVKGAVAAVEAVAATAIATVEGVVAGAASAVENVAGAVGGVVGGVVSGVVGGAVAVVDGVVAGAVGGANAVGTSIAGNVTGANTTFKSPIPVVSAPETMAELIAQSEASRVSLNRAISNIPMF